MNTVRATFRNTGYSLVELMVAMALGLLISAGVITIFIGTKGTQRTQDMLVEVQESGRAAMDILAYDLRMAGATGLTYPSNPITVETTQAPNAQIPDVGDNCFTNATQAFDWATALAATYTSPGHKSPTVYGEDNIGADGVSKVFRCIKSSGRDLPAQPGSDILSIHYLAPEKIAAKDLQAGELYAYSSLEKAEIFQCPKSKSGTNCAPELTSGAEEYLRVISRVYYIRPWSVTEGDGIPTLVRLNISRGKVVEEPLVEGIASLQVLYGVDNDDDGYVDQFKDASRMPALSSPAGLGTDWSKIKAVKVSLLAESLSDDRRNGAGETSVDVAGQRITVPQSKFARVFSFTAAVRNPRARGG